jgi:hypothetical protein
MQKSVAFLYTNNTQTEKEIREIIPTKIASKNNKVPQNKFNKRTKDLSFFGLFIHLFLCAYIVWAIFSP